MKTNTHVKRLALILAAVCLVGFAAQRLAQPATFGRIGHYREASLDEIASQEMTYQGRSECRTCHTALFKTHAKDIHFKVECEVCHGPGRKHVEHHRTRAGSPPGPDAVMPREFAFKRCLYCHRKLGARPRDFAQVDPKEHYAFLGIKGKPPNCIACHDPHEPLFLGKSVAEARLHPSINKCSDCHAKPPRESHREVEGHPVLFLCRDCHPSIARDFPKHQHAFMECTSCHLFYRENSGSGRILKNTSRRFCLLCHEKRPFKDSRRIPLIDFTEHVRTMAPIMRLQASAVENHPEACLKCHIDIAHDSRLIQRLREHQR